MKTPRYWWLQSKRKVKRQRGEFKDEMLEAEQPCGSGLKGAGDFVVALIKMEGTLKIEDSSSPLPSLRMCGVEEQPTEEGCGGRRAQAVRSHEGRESNGGLE
jgi:hypothetical protein